MNIPINHKLALAQEVAGRLAELDIPAEYFDDIKASAFAKHGHVLVIDRRAKEQTMFMFSPVARVHWGTYPTKLI